MYISSCLERSKSLLENQDINTQKDQQKIQMML